ncbi:MAG: zinc ABC transporter ATP-binding protein [Epsilonproteobacteria bacterium]|nr:MAG: zinc ABC transporter ATP-binding protein [Campylobacterota bacterium]
MPVIHVEALNYFVGKQEILSDISCDIEQGDYVALIGPNGGGKTTLVKMILGLQTPSSGKIDIFGIDRKHFKSWHKVGYVPQNVSLFDNNFPLSVYEAVSLGLAAKKSWFSKINQEEKIQIEEAIHIASIEEFRDKNLSELSGGQRQRVMIARALVSQPEILILDEPSTGVDIASQHKFYDFLRRLNREQNLTIIFITHDLGVIADDVTHVLSINQKLVYSGTAETMLSCEAVSEVYGTKAHVVHTH